MASRNRGGRPPELSQDVQDLIVKGMLAGNYLETAATAAGVWADTVRRWVRRGVKERQRRERGLKRKQAEDRYVDFAARFLEAEASAEAGAALELRAAGKKDWRASVEFLERRYPKRWGSRVNIILEEEIGAILDRLEERLDPDTYAKVVEALDDEGDQG